VYSTATNLANRKAKGKGEDGEDQSPNHDFISGDRMVIGALGQLAAYVTWNDLGQSSNLNSFLFIRKVFTRQLGFWKDQNNQDALHSLVGIPEALLMERTGQIDKLHDFIICLTAYVKICPEFCLYLVPTEHETLQIIEFIYMSTLAMLPNASKFTIKEQVRTDFRKSVFGYLDLCARFWDQIFSQLNSQLTDRILRGRTLKNKQGIAKNFYKAHCEEMFMETMGFVTAHMEQSRINGKKRSVKFLKILVRLCPFFKELLKNLEDFLPDDEEHIEFFEYKKKVLDLEPKKTLIKLAEEAAAKEILQKNLDAERIEREKFDQNAVEAQGKIDDN
jgi:hypothetical protein